MLWFLQETPFELLAHILEPVLFLSANISRKRAMLIQNWGKRWGSNRYYKIPIQIFQSKKQKQKGGLGLLFCTLPFQKASRSPRGGWLRWLQQGICVCAEEFLAPGVPWGTTAAGLSPVASLRHWPHPCSTGVSCSFGVLLACGVLFMVTHPHPLSSLN